MACEHVHSEKERLIREVCNQCMLTENGRLKHALAEEGRRLLAATTTIETLIFEVKGQAAEIEKLRAAVQRLA